MTNGEKRIMAHKQPITVVTGGNRGIGLEVCRQLAARGALVVLTARQAAAGKEAVDRLAAQKLPVQFHALDVTDPASAKATIAKLNAERKETPRSTLMSPMTAPSLPLTLGGNKAKTPVPQALFAFEPPLRRHGEYPVTSVKYTHVMI